MGGLCGQGVVRNAPEFISNVLYLCSFRDRLFSDSQSEHQYPCLPQLIALISPRLVQLYTAAVDLVETQTLSSLLPSQHMKPLIARLEPTSQVVCPALLLF